MVVYMNLVRGRFWHLSDKFLGREVILLPRVPRDRALGEDEHTPRVCVASRVEGALVALRNVYYVPSFWHVYCVLVPWEWLDLGEVPDASETGELWVLRPVEGFFCGLVEPLPRTRQVLSVE